MAKRKRRTFTTEFKAQTVRLIRESGKSVGAVARELDLAETAVRRWVQQAEVDAGRGNPGALTTEEREELGRLRRENRTLRMERDILKNQSGTARAAPPVRRETGDAAMLIGAPGAVAVSFMVTSRAR
jgi:transposase